MTEGRKRGPVAGFMERVFRYVGLWARKARDGRDLKRINRAAFRLNVEAADVLEYQAPLDLP